MEKLPLIVVTDEAAADDATADEATPDDATPDDATVEEATIDDATTEDATIDEATVDDATIDDAEGGLELAKNDALDDDDSKYFYVKIFFKIFLLGIPKITERVTMITIAAIIPKTIPKIAKPLSGSFCGKRSFAFCFKDFFLGGIVF